MKTIFCITGLAIQGLAMSAQAQTGPACKGRACAEETGKDGRKHPLYLAQKPGAFV